MTDKELLHQLLRRNHQLTAKCEGLTKRIEQLESNKQIDVTQRYIEYVDERLNRLCERIHVHVAAFGLICENVEPPLEFKELFPCAEQITEQNRLEDLFDLDATDKEDGHS